MSEPTNHLERILRELQTRLHTSTITHENESYLGTLQRQIDDIHEQIILSHSEATAAGRIRVDPYCPDDEVYFMNWDESAQRPSVQRISQGLLSEGIASTPPGPWEGGTFTVPSGASNLRITTSSGANGGTGGTTASSGTTGLTFAQVAEAAQRVISDELQLNMAVMQRAYDGVADQVLRREYWGNGEWVMSPRTASHAMESAIAAVQPRDLALKWEMSGEGQRFQDQMDVAMEEISKELCA